LAAPPEKKLINLWNNICTIKELSLSIVFERVVNFALYLVLFLNLITKY